MSDFSEDKIERSNDGKFAPKATSETEIDLASAPAGSTGSDSLEDVYDDGLPDWSEPADPPPF